MSILIDTACVGVPVSRDHDDVTNANQQPIYSSVNDTDIRPRHQHETSSSAAAAAAVTSSDLAKYVHETPI